MICTSCRSAADMNIMEFHNQCHGCDCQHREKMQ